MLQQILTSADFWKHASIPVVAAVIGWATNWVAIRLTFKPLEFVGIPPYLGWQGIIPSKAGKMAGIFVDSTMHRLGTLDELFRAMEPEEIARHISELMDARLEAYTDEVMFYGRPRLWRLLPGPMKQRVYDRVREQMPRLVDNLVEEITENLEELIDFRQMLVDRLENDKGLLNRLFQESGEKEFRFIIISGFWFGLLFGLVQLAVWIFYRGWWVLPAFGILVGYATNWFAINIIFRPLRPTRIGPYTVQGLFLKRQKEVAAVWCRLVTSEIITLQHIIYAMVYGPRSARAKALIQKHIRPIVDEVLDGFPAPAQAVVGGEGVDDLRDSVGRKAVEVSTDPFDHWPFNRDRARRAEQLLRERMESLPSEEFQDLLRPCFQEDELKLILTGAVLGFLAGWAQLVFVFGGAG